MVCCFAGWSVKTETIRDVYTGHSVLRDCGYVCVLEETPDWNQVEVVVHGERVYKCDINKLEFGGDGRLDPLCQEALDAVRNAFQQHQI
ncbi:UPF0728 protein C10orf53 homolog isoform X2 [Tachysurus fulvidraco]|uniref:UPF0728 protein C10orf53 homolog isoform X2 n=1 Tax=Tachysurus fulvidraco TaxID=1234273 RepID=UPI001FF004CE|nr:UPF0728 protein C10orf53 homolog isoform X2 [Tachysurus fulvidraco]